MAVVPMVVPSERTIKTRRLLGTDPYSKLEAGVGSRNYVIEY